MIVFGHNNFKIKSFTPQELRLPREESTNNIDIQVRQRYAHIFWIPFFPIGKIYAFKRKGDSNMYELPINIKQTIQTRHKDEIKTPWYSYSLILIALTIGLGIFANGKISDINRENNFYKKQAETEMMIKYPTTGDYYSFGANPKIRTNYNSNSIVLKVNSYDDNSIEFTSGYEDLFEQDISEYNISKEFERAGEYIYHPTRIDKELLLKMVKREYRDYNEKEYEMEQYDNMMFKFKSIKRQKLENL